MPLADTSSDRSFIVKEGIFLETYLICIAVALIGGLMLSPAFDPQKGTYYCTTANESDTVTATAADSAATVAITNGSETVANGSAATWVSGKNTLTITVTSGEFTRDYVVHVTYNAV